MRLRQIALVGRDLDRIAADIEAVLGLGRPYHDPNVERYGLRNAVWPIGDTFLEVVSPVREGTTAGRLLDKRGRDGGYMTIFQTRDIAAARARVTAHGVRIVDQVDLKGAQFTHLHPKDLVGAIASIDAMDPPESWLWAGPNWMQTVRSDMSLSIVGAQLEVAKANEVSRRWAQVLDLESHEQPKHWRLPLEKGELRFVEAASGEGDGLNVIDVLVRDPSRVEGLARARGCVDATGSVALCGVRVRAIQVSR